MRPKECVAEQCNVINGRNYCYDENNEYLLILCTCCGSNGVHECCLNGKEDFVCSVCEPPSKKRRKINETIDVDTIQCEQQPELPSKKRRKIAKSIENTDMNNNLPLNVSSEASTSKTDFVLWEISIKLTPLDNFLLK